MNYTEFLKWAADKNACSLGLEYAQKFTTFDKFYQSCERGDWLLWFIGKLVNRSDNSQLRMLVLAKARCAKLAKHLMKDERSIRAVETAERFGLGTATMKELTEAAAYATAAYAAAAEVAAAAAYAAAADAAAYAAYAAAAAEAAEVAADAAEVAADAAVVRKKILQQCAEVVRDVFTVKYIEKLWKETQGDYYTKVMKQKQGELTSAQQVQA